MSKIGHDNVHAQAHTNSSSSANVSAAHGASSRRVGGVAARPFRQQIGAFLGMRKLRRMMSPLQVSDSDLNPITSRNNEQMITDLSRMLVNLENSGDASEDKEILKMMIQESVRRIMIVERQRVNSNHQVK